MTNHDVQFVHVAIDGRPQRNDLLVSTGERDTSRSHLLIGFDLLSERDINGVYDGRVLQGIVHHIAVSVKIPPIKVGVIVSIQGRARMESVGGLPLIGHVISIGVFQPR